MNMPKQNRKPGFTLLEVLLAAALTAVLMGSLCWAIDLYARLVNAGRTRAAQMQLSRAVLNRIAEDLRGAIYPEPVDVSSIQAMMSGAAANAASALQQSGGDENQPPTTNPPTTNPPTTGQPSTGQPSETEQPPAETETTPVTSDSTPSAVPGVYGDIDILQIDVSRLPRHDEYYGSLDAASGLLRSPHDVRTVTYFLSTGTDARGQSVSGLVRREVNRAAGLYAGSNGGAASGADDQLLAPEVIGFELHYFDGTEWLTAWDASEKKGLPLAVEIAIEVQAEQRGADASSLSSWINATGDAPQTETYRLIIDLPAAKLSEASTTQSTEQPADSSQESTSQSGSPMP